MAWFGLYLTTKYTEYTKEAIFHELMCFMVREPRNTLNTRKDMERVFGNHREHRGFWGNALPDKLMH